MPGEQPQTENRVVVHPSKEDHDEHWDLRTRQLFSDREGELLFIPSYPFLALSIFALDILVLYGLLPYGGRPELS